MWRALRRSRETPLVGRLSRAARGILAPPAREGGQRFRSERPASSAAGISHFPHGFILKETTKPGGGRAFILRTDFNRRQPERG
jgi:hypothetical protein